MASSAHPSPVPQAADPATRRYHHGDLPAALKQAAVELIARHGVQGFSLREAAMSVGVSPSAAYRHFQDKAALLRSIAADAFLDMGQRFDQAMQSVPGRGVGAARARFMAQGRAYVDFALEQPERFAVMFGPQGAGACSSGGSGQALPAGPWGALARALDDLVQAGVLPRERREGAELLAWSAIHGLATLLVSGALAHAPGQVAAMTQRVGEDCLRAMAHRP